VQLVTDAPYAGLKKLVADADTVCD